MTINEFYNINVGNYVKLNRTGEVMVVVGKCSLVDEHKHVINAIKGNVILQFEKEELSISDVVEFVLFHSK